MSPDPIQITDERLFSPSTTLNMYGYAANNPLKFVDPDGQDVTYFYDQKGVAGHAILFAFDPKNGKSAIESFGPVKHAPRAKGKSMFDMEVPKSPDQLRSIYSAITITTNPVLTQKVIDYINTHPDPATWVCTGPNCSTQVFKILNEFSLIRNRYLDGGAYPSDVWQDLDRQYGTVQTDKPTGGVDYGKHSADPFNAFWQTILQWQQNQNSNSQKKPDGSDGGALPTAKRPWF